MPDITNLTYIKTNIEKASIDYVSSFVGCTSPSAMNWNKTATVDDGSCIETNYGGVF